MKKLFLPAIFLVLGYGFWVSPQFKEISAGVAIFLFGMLSLEEGFKAFTGGVLEKLLKGATNRLWKSLSFGFITTSIMQSSSLVSLVTISFLSAGLIELAQGVGIIFGANIGTTTGAWLVAGLGMKVNISSYAMPILVFGVILMFQANRMLKGAGYILSGLGFLFLGIHHMKEGFEAYRGSIDLVAYAMPGILGVLVFTLIGTLATVVMQSSHATLVLIITALAAGQISYENALALAIGANIGTTITAILGALSANIAGKQLAAAHLIFNVVTAAIAIGLLQPMALLVDSCAQWLGIADDNYMLKLAIFHTLFNLVGVLVMLPWIRHLVRWLKRTLLPRNRRRVAELVAGQEDRRIEPERPRYLKAAVLSYPDTALEAIIREVRHLFDNAFGVMSHGLFLHRSDLLSDKPLQEVVERAGIPKSQVDVDKLYKMQVRAIYSELIAFAARAQTGMSESQMQLLFALKLASRDIVEAVKDVKHLQKNMRVQLQQGTPVMQQQYNNIRIQLGSLLRELSRMRGQGSAEETLLTLARLKREMLKVDILSSGVLDQLIRGDEISESDAASLINDYSYALRVAQNLLAMAEVLFSASSSGAPSVEQAIALDSVDIEQLLQADNIDREGV
ncbi:Na/Pi cotransporter family protein [Aestuariirhabdus litorea]|uniref:Na/Pi cotransporter family protein n=1 Tax=Aestuariirhabdus litorea TaxID=2528527 RepID=A0A3P3VIC7_9GAMM|nr:Na/Pi symporter [Aestuariirhabdus litorea]RRJ82491.1 Na/Pi cotransporter family protein [Aestuariirhabdus litorea]RWW92652.1 Na/Pi cotransporter family protein [Endozoicomonadaceae bacterium GTF-13]